jgi:hypothetical protein
VCLKTKKIEQNIILQFSHTQPINLERMTEELTEESNHLANPNNPITITNQVPGYYKCGHCALHFKTRARFSAHEATCLSLKQIRARATFAPDAPPPATTTTMNDLFALVQQLAVRLETAEHELATLKRQQQQQQRQQQRQRQEIHRDNLLQWLNDEDKARLKALKPFSEWLPAIPPITRDHLALVFQHGFMDGMCAIIASLMSASCPLGAYDEAPSTLFIYEQHPREGAPEKAMNDDAAKWRPMTHPEFERFINRMQKLLMNEFVCWQQEHMAQLHDSDFAEQYDANLMKVMGSGKAKGGGCSNRDMLMTRMKSKVYAAIKRSANAIMQ